MLIFGFLVIGLAATVHSRNRLVTTICIENQQLKNAAKNPQETCRILELLVKNNLLNLSSQNIISMEKDSLEDAGGLRGIILSANGLTDTSCLLNLQDSIERVQMSNNKITEITSGDFERFYLFSHLNISFNDIQELKGNTFKNFRSLTFLSLNNNRINKIEPEFFEGIENLERLWLKKNELSSLEKDVFARLTSLKTVSLAYNKFTIFREFELFGPTVPRSLKKVSFRQNPFDRTIVQHPSTLILNYPCMSYIELPHETLCMISVCESPSSCRNAIVDF